MTDEKDSETLEKIYNKLTALELGVSTRLTKTEVKQENFEKLLESHSTRIGKKADVKEFDKHLENSTKWNVAIVIGVIGSAITLITGLASIYVALKGS